MPDPVLDPAATPTPAPGVPLDAVKSLVEEFKATMVEVREAKTAPAAPLPSRTDPQAEYNQARERYDALMADGKSAEGFELMIQAATKVANANAPSPNDHPALKAGVELAEREAKRNYPELFKRFGKEITLEMEALSIDRRISPNQWDDAVTKVRARHFDELVEEARTTEREKVKADFLANVPTSAPGSRGSIGRAADGLDNIDSAIASAAGIEPEVFKKYKAHTDAHFAGTDGAYDIPLDIEPNKRVRPGSF